MFSATLGARTVHVRMANKSVELCTKTKTIATVKNLCAVYFQRLNKRLKTCDAVFIDSDTNDAHIITIEKANIETIRDHVECAVYMGGPDPLPWKKFVSDAKKHQWSQEDWQYFFEVSSSESEPEDDASDSDWAPESEASDDDASEDDAEDTHAND